MLGDPDGRRELLGLGGQVARSCGSCPWACPSTPTRTRTAPARPGRRPRRRTPAGSPRRRGRRSPRSTAGAGRRYLRPDSQHRHEVGSATIPPTSHWEPAGAGRARSGVNSGFSGTAIAPSTWMARKVVTNSWSLPSTRATPSPGPIPRASSVPPPAGARRRRARPRCVVPIRRPAPGDHRPARPWTRTSPPRSTGARSRCRAARRCSC